MDLLALLRSKASSIPVGDHSRGLSSVLIHIEAAFGHLARGQSQAEDTAYTDAIYRTNLAFEGGVKEAYRVLAGKDPSKQRPFDIEKYLEVNKTLRPRILAQFTTYRTDWRNPSAHDYTLDFDEGEALLAIVSVSAFVYVLLDEISEKLAAEAAKQTAETQAVRRPARGSAAGEADLLFEVAHALEAFASEKRLASAESMATLLGSIHGFLSVVVADADTHVDVAIGASSLMADVMVLRDKSAVFIEVKRSSSGMSLRSGLNQLYALAEAADTDGLLFILSDQRDVQTHFVAHPSHRLAVISSSEQAKFLFEGTENVDTPDTEST